MAVGLDRGSEVAVNGQHLTEAVMTNRPTGLLLSIAWLALGALAASGAEGDARPARKIVRAEDGLSIVCDVRGKGDTALVFLHGWCGDREYWKRQADAFAA